MDRLSAAAFVVALWLTAAIASPAQTFATLISFDGADGANPAYASLVQGRDGNYYGTTSLGGGDNRGEVFNITPSGTLHKLKVFRNANGSNPNVGLVLALDGHFYGTTGGGGPNNGGTVFKITDGGRLTTLYDFCPQGGKCNDGNASFALVQASDGSFYGVTGSGGSNGWGTVFKITAKGKLTTLHSFCSQSSSCLDGATPIGGLIQAADGNFYGTTLNGPANGDYGTVFKITPTGKLTTLHTFGYTDGANPYAGLVQAADGNLYGTTSRGGNSACQGGCGTVFKITPSGDFTLLHGFEGGDGEDPRAPLIQATNGDLYGTTTDIPSGFGGIFRITLSGTLSRLHGFDGNDGSYPYAGLVQATNGIFYGVTEGTYARGTVFSLSMGLSPFVAFVRSSGKVGATAEILGQGFTGTSGVSFNRTAANFVVHSDTYLTATVPQGATTGFVTVTTPGGTLQSNVVFRVRN